MVEKGYDPEEMLESAKPVIDELLSGSNPQPALQQFLRVYGDEGNSLLTHILYSANKRDTRTLRLSPEKISGLGEQIELARLSLSFSPSQIQTYQELRSRYVPRGYKDV